MSENKNTLGSNRPSKKRSMNMVNNPERFPNVDKENDANFENVNRQRPGV